MFEHKKKGARGGWVTYSEDKELNYGGG